MTAETLQMLESFFYQQRKGNLIHLNLQHLAPESWNCELYKERANRQRFFRAPGATMHEAIEHCLEEVQKIYNLAIRPGLVYRLLHGSGGPQRLAVWNELEPLLAVGAQFSLFYYYKESRGSRWQARLNRTSNSRAANPAAAIRRLIHEAALLPVAEQPA